MDTQGTRFGETKPIYPHQTSNLSSEIKTNLLKSSYRKAIYNATD